ncbi:hypothetical protein DYH52_01340 [Morganella morganii]|nr:hypothetical protein DYH52_01340 [Morganella morganii]
MLSLTALPVSCAVPFLYPAGFSPALSELCFVIYRRRYDRLRILSFPLFLWFSAFCVPKNAFASTVILSLC